MTDYTWMEGYLETLVFPAALGVGIIALMLVLRSIALSMLSRWAGRTETRVDDIILDVFKTPSLYWALATGIYIGLAVSSLPERYVHYMTEAVYVLVIISVTVASANLLGRIFKSYVQKLGLPIPTTGLANGLIKGVVYATGALVVLSVLGISIAPMITALGVGGLAVALALQDTLANLFAGIHILVEHSIRVGDFVELESGQKGYVNDITWRTTRVRMLGNNIVVIPNGKLSQSIITNYNLPEKRMSLLVPIGVNYCEDPERIERILIEEARLGAAEIPGLLSQPEPFVRFIPGFGESSLDFTLICQVKEFVDQYLAQHELRKRIFKRFRAEGIDIPFPHRTVYLREEKDWNR